MKLKVLSEQDCEQVRIWRNDALESLRTPFPLTLEQQNRFFHEVVCDRRANARYWGIWDEVEVQVLTEYIENYNPAYGTGYPVNKYETARQDSFIGMCGIENIEWENKRGEISIILNPEYHGKGYGEKAIELLLEQGFMYMNLDNIYGECYENNPAIEFWKKVIKKYSPDYEPIWLDCTKYYDGQYWDSLWFNIEKTDYLKATKPIMGVVFDEYHEVKSNEQNNT